MYKIFIVGLGGSGGKTLQFLMDQLSGELRDRGWKHDRLPRCWQFVHIDVPSQPDGRDSAEGLPATVPDQGGQYIAVTTPNDHYAQLDAGLEKNLSQIKGGALRQLVGWRPDATRVTTPIVRGAGQYRAVGRLATLARSGTIFKGLIAAARDLNSSEADEDFVELRRTLGLRYAPEPQGTMVMVVSSLAGGTGASMTLDVCNLLRGMQNELPNFPGGESIAYLYTPDVFSQLDDAQIGGVNANALGTIAELMSAQAASQRRWTTEEWDIYRSGGHPPTTGRGPKAVFPVGATNGISGSRFGDGRAVTIYRGFSRALAAIFLSESQQTQTMSYVVGNFGTTVAPDDSELAWASHGGQELLAFGALGFASIGLGRDRYAEYVAQRLARLAVKRLLRGHVDASVTQGKRTENEARDQYAQQGYQQFLRWAELPVTRPTTGEALAAWTFQIWSADRQAGLADTAVIELFEELGTAGKKQKSTWFAAQLSSRIPTFFHRISGQADSFAQNAGQAWVPDIQTRIESAVLLCIGRWGLPVTQRIVERFEGDLHGWAGRLRSSSSAVGNVSQLTTDTMAPLYAIDGQIDRSHAALAHVDDTLRGEFSTLILARTALVAGELAEALATDVVQPLLSALSDTFSGLVAKEGSQTVDLVVSSVRTQVVQAWPEGERVPTRFATATNEVLLEDIETYPGRFRNHIYETFATTTMPTGARPGDEESTLLAVEQVATFLDIDPSGGRPPKPAEKIVVPGRGDRGPVKINRRSSWWPRLFAGSAPHQTAWYEPRLSAADILEGAREWVGRDGFPLRSFTRQGLKSYLGPAGPVGTTQRERLEEDFALKFREALRLAAPLVGVHPGMVTAVHGNPVTISYQFSAAPIQAAPAAIKQIKLAIAAEPSIDDRVTVAALDQAMAGEEANVDLPRIDVIGNYAQPYSPIVFSSLQQPIQKQWSQSTGVQERMKFWRWRRGRPLNDFVPVSPEWFQAFITGWLIGRLTGEILLPAPGETSTAVRVWDDGRWRLFPDPLLGVEQIHKDLVGWAIPAALIESMPLAIAQCNGDPLLTALQAYIATRRLGEELPLSGYKAHPAIHAWFVDGVSRSGSRPQILKPDSRVNNPDQRRAHAVGWLERLRDAIRDTHLPEGAHGATGKGTFATITHHNFTAVPREWEIAEQLIIGIDEVLEEVNRPENMDKVPPVDPGINNVEY